MSGAMYGRLMTLALVRVAVIFAFAQFEAAHGFIHSKTIEAAKPAVNVAVVQFRTNSSRKESAAQQTNQGQSQTLLGLTELLQDEQVAQAEEMADVKAVERKLAVLLRQRDVQKRDAERKGHEIAFLQGQIARLQSKKKEHLSAEETSTLAADAATAQAAASVIIQGSSTELDVTYGTDGRLNAAAAAAEASTEKELGELGSSMKQSSSAKQGSQAVVQMTAAEKAKLEAQMEAAAEAKVRAEAAAKAHEEELKKARLEEETRKAAEAAKIKAEEQRRAKETAKQREADKLADSADDSFKDFMKEEDGEDQIGDADYEDSANALAGAIGWNRKAVETNANNAVRQLTEAIGGKKVVKSLQGMMAGIR